MKKTASLLVATAAIALGGCGGASDSDVTVSDRSEDSSSPSDVPSSDLPLCSELWKVGEVLDLNEYRGCEEVVGEGFSGTTSAGCYGDDFSYRGQFATYDDRFWVLQTGTDDKTGEGGTPGTITDVDPVCEQS